MSSTSQVPSGEDSLTRPYTVHNISVDGVSLFYREAGSPSAPTILLLHGYPSSSHQYRHLIPLLSPHFHVLAPDYPGFGFTTVPAERNYSYTFDNLAQTVSLWLQKLNITSYTLYIFDYGAPIGLRLATANPSAVTAIISQNGNAYTEGLGPAISVLTNYYNHPTDPSAVQAAKDFISYEGTKYQYVTGAPDPGVIEPESYTLDAALLARPGNVQVQLDLFRDYKSNVALYPAWQAYLRENQPPLLAVWAKDDPIFVPAGAEAFKRDVREAEVRLVEGPHFVLDTDVTGVAWLVLDFLRRKGVF